MPALRQFRYSHLTLKLAQKQTAPESFLFTFWGAVLYYTTIAYFK